MAMSKDYKKTKSDHRVISQSLNFNVCSTKHVQK